MDLKLMGQGIVAGAEARERAQATRPQGVESGGDPLHPDGRCTCAGEGLCTWCVEHQAPEEEVDEVEPAERVAPASLDLVRTLARLRVLRDVAPPQKGVDTRVRNPAFVEAMLEATARFGVMTIGAAMATSPTSIQRWAAKLPPAAPPDRGEPPADRMPRAAATPPAGRLRCSDPKCGAFQAAGALADDPCRACGRDIVPGHRPAAAPPRAMPAPQPAPAPEQARRAPDAEPPLVVIEPPPRTITAAELRALMSTPPDSVLDAPREKPDAELDALAACVAALRPLDQRTRARALAYLNSRWSL